MSLLSITQIKPEHNAAIRQIIESVGAEFGAIGQGFGPSDAEVQAMSEHYRSELKSRYLIASYNNKVIGGCGIAPFNNSAQTCELRKLFLLPENRRNGIGETLVQLCLDFAIEQNFQQCYLDTLSSMTAAIALYKKLGFNHLPQPMTGTEHNGCDIWMIKHI